MFKKILFSLSVVLFGIIVFFLAFLNATHKQFIAISKEKIEEKDFNFFLKNYSIFFNDNYIYEFHDEDTNLSILFVNTYTHLAAENKDFNALTVYVATAGDAKLYDDKNEENKAAILFYFSNDEVLEIKLNDKKYMLAGLYSQLNYFAFDLFKNTISSDSKYTSIITKFELTDFDGNIIFTTSNDNQFVDIDLNTDDFETIVEDFLATNPEGDILAHLEDLNYIRGFNSQEQTEIFAPKMGSVYLAFGIYAVFAGAAGYYIFRKKK